MARGWALVLGIAAAACSNSGVTTAGVSGKDGGGEQEASTTPPKEDGSAPLEDGGGTVNTEDGDVRATACTAPPFVNFGAKLTELDVSGAKTPLAGARISFTTCSGFNLTTDATGAATTQITKGIPLTPIYDDGTTTIGAVGGEIPAMVDVSPAVTLFAYDVSPSIPGFVQDGGNAAMIAILLQVDPAATAPCNVVSGVTLAVTGHPEAVVSYAGNDWPGDTSVTTTSSVGPYVFIGGVQPGGLVSVTGTLSGCSVELVTASQTGRFALVNGVLTMGLATITN
jgi:hypothetical protein